MDNHLEFRHREFATFLKYRNSTSTSTNARPRARVERLPSNVPANTPTNSVPPSSSNAQRTPAFVLPPLPSPPFSSSQDTSLLSTAAIITYPTSSVSSVPSGFASSHERATVVRPVPNTSAALPPLPVKTMPPSSSSSSELPTVQSVVNLSDSTLKTFSSGVSPETQVGSDTMIRSVNVATFNKTNVGSGKKRPRELITENDEMIAKSRRTNEKIYVGTTSPVAVSNIVIPSSVTLTENHSNTGNVRNSGTVSAISGMKPNKPLGHGEENTTTTPGFDCDRCNSRFCRKHHLERHIQNIHEGQRPWTCNHCGFRFHQKPNLERHIMTVHEEQKPFTCKACGMAFGRKGILKKHVQMVHEHSRRFECDRCPILFGLKSDLKRHVQTVHRKERPFVCQVCSASFGRRSDLKRHTLSLHPGAALPTRKNSGPQKQQRVSS